LTRDPQDNLIRGKRDVRGGRKGMRASYLFDWSLIRTARHVWSRRKYSKSSD